MKLQLDTENKTIKIESDILLKDLVRTLEKLLPKGEWKEFTLQTHTTINNWNSPIVIREYPRYKYWEQPWYSALSSKEEFNKDFSLNKVNNLKAINSVSLKAGTFNLELPNNEV